MPTASVAARVSAVGIAAVVSLTACVSPVEHVPQVDATDGGVLELPQPTGTFAVGGFDFELVDGARSDPWQSGADRRLMLSVRFPADAVEGEAAPYVDAVESSALLASLGVDGLPDDLLTEVRTYTFPVATPHEEAGGLPIVVLSPGFGLPRSSLSGLAEDLASHGFLTVAIGHDGEAVATTFPDGSLTECTACADEDDVLRVPAVRADDIGFVLDRLAEGYGRFAELPPLDFERIGVVGHSIGGNSAAQVMAERADVRAGVDMDGAFLAPLPADGLDRPFLLFGTEESFLPGSATEEPSWSNNWPGFLGWKRWVTVAGTDHESFTDYPMLAQQLGQATTETTGSQAMQLTRKYIRAFLTCAFDASGCEVFEGEPQDPEIRFWNGE